MPEITEVQLIDPRSFAVTDGGTTDTYRGIKRVGYTKNAPRTLPILKESELKPSSQHQIATTTPAVTGTISCDSHTVDVLAGTTADSFAVTAFEAGTSNTVTKTFTTVNFEQVDGNVDRVSIGGYTLRFSAASVADS